MNHSTDRHRLARLALASTAAIVAPMSAESAAMAVAPELDWATFIGSSGYDNLGLHHTVAVAPNGEVVVAGETSSPGFPTTVGAYDRTHNGQRDVFVCRLSADGATLVWSTLIGGAEIETPRALVLDPSGEVCLTGTTRSPDFPTTAGSPAHAGAVDAFACRLSADGSQLLWSTLLGGPEDDAGFSLDSDGAGGLVVGCGTYCASLPTTPGAYDASYNGGGDFYVVRLDTNAPASQPPVWATYLGGAGVDYCNDLRLSESGEVTFAGWTDSADFPTSPGAFQASFGGGIGDAVAGRLSADGATLLWSTYYGGSMQDAANSVAIEDGTGLVFVSGVTESADLPVPLDAYDDSHNGGWDACVACFDPTASGPAQLVWGTFLGGSLGDGSNDMALDALGGVVLVGATESDDYPTTPGACDATPNGGYDALVARFDRSLAGPDQLVYSTYLGGAELDSAYTVAAQPLATVTFAGLTHSADFPATPGAHDGTYGGNGDAVIARLELVPAVVAYCFGDGSGTLCPCGNAGGPGEGCANSTGAGGLVGTTGTTSVALDELTFEATHLLQGQPGLLFQGESALNGGAGFPFGDGLRCAGVNVIRLGVETPDPSGAASWGPGLAGPGGWVAGDTRTFQVWYRDPSGSPCGMGFNLTNGLEVQLVP